MRGQVRIHLRFIRRAIPRRDLITDIELVLLQPVVAFGLQLVSHLSRQPLDVALARAQPSPRQLKTRRRDLQQQHVRRPVLAHHAYRPHTPPFPFLFVLRAHSQQSLRRRRVLLSSRPFRPKRIIRQRVHVHHPSRPDAERIHRLALVFLPVRRFLVLRRRRRRRRLGARLRRLLLLLLPLRLRALVLGDDVDVLAKFDLDVVRVALVVARRVVVVVARRRRRRWIARGRIFAHRRRRRRLSRASRRRHRARSNRRRFARARAGPRARAASTCDDLKIESFIRIVIRTQTRDGARDGARDARDGVPRCRAERRARARAIADARTRARTRRGNRSGR